MNSIEGERDFLKWIQNYDHRHLRNEDDVETKFVIPMFRLLNYPEKCRSGKFPIKTHNPKKAGKKPEIDQAYFSSEKFKEQNEDTCLLIVEAKKPKKLDNKTQLQADFYSFSLKPLVFILTDGFYLKGFQYHRHRSDEIVFDATTDALKDSKIAQEFYENFNFETLKQLKKQTSDLLSHRQYVKLEKTLQNYPEIQTILEQGDFRPSLSKSDRKGSPHQKKRKIAVVESKVAIEADLPFAFEYCNFKIEFSHIIRRGLSLVLTHQDIFANFMMGLNNPPSWNTRKFLKQIDESTYEAKLGHVTTFLSEAEAIDFCKCVDVVCGEYKNIVLRSESLLETETFMLFYDGKEDFMRKNIQFYLFSIKPELWKVILQFKREFDYDNGDSKWHIFDKRFDFLWIHEPKNKFITHAFVFPNESREGGYIDLLYCVPEWFLDDFKDWTEHIGPKGIWTATYTKDWLLNQLIPHVIKYAQENSIKFKDKEKYIFVSKSKENNIFTHKIRDWIVDRLDNREISKFIDCCAYHIDTNSFSDSYIPLQDIKERRILIPEIENPKQIGQYIENIQNWLHHRRENVDVNILLPILRSYSELIKCIDPLSVDLRYIKGKVNSIGRSYKKKEEYAFESKEKITFEDIIDYFEYFLEKIEKYNTLSYSDADDIFRVCCAISDGKFLNYQQSQLNSVKKAIQPLWELRNFETRYVFTHWGWNGLYYEN